MRLAHAAFDESGTHDNSPVLCVAGYVIANENLEEFNSNWLGALAEKNLTHFHMVDCAHGNGECAKLSKTERIDLQTKLINIIRTYVTRGIGAMVVADVYKQLMPFHPNMGSAYNYCIWHCLEAVKMWIEEEGQDIDVRYYFEQGHQSDHEASRILSFAFAKPGSGKPFGYASHNFVDKKSMPGVQAADLLAWQMFTDWRHGMEKRPRRKDFEYLISDKKHRVCIIDAKRILYHVELMKKMNAW